MPHELEAAAVVSNQTLTDRPLAVSPDREALLTPNAVPVPVASRAKDSHHPARLPLQDYGGSLLKGQRPLPPAIAHGLWDGPRHPEDTLIGAPGEDLPIWSDILTSTHRDRGRNPQRLSVHEIGSVSTTSSRPAWLLHQTNNNAPAVTIRQQPSSTCSQQANGQVMSWSLMTFSSPAFRLRMASTAA